MSKLSLLAVIALGAYANVVGQPADPTESESQQLIAACNDFSDSTRPKRRSIKACEALDDDGRLALVDTDAVVAYRRYQDEVKRREAEIRASPRGESRRH